MNSPRPTAGLEKNHSVSFFEFWPAWVMYAPVGVQWVILSLYYRSITLPFLANPKLTLSGMVGVGKSELMEQATGLSAQTILPWITHDVDDAPVQSQAQDSIEKARNHDIELPFVCKPDIGCRGAGVKLVKNAGQLAGIIKSYPSGAVLVYQKLAAWESEVGIFYVKNPKSGLAEIVSITQKTLPRVTGDGKSTLGELIERDPRAGKLLHQYTARHKHAWDSVPEKGDNVRLVFSASHSKGCVFTDARHLITPELTQTISNIMDSLPDFYYGRLDVKFKNIASLKQGKNIQIVEINGASAESAHIWDKDAKFFDAITTLLWQYRTLFKIGAHHRAAGKTPPSLSAFLNHWRKERRLTKHYPYTD